MTALLMKALGALLVAMALSGAFHAWRRRKDPKPLPDHNFDVVVERSWIHGPYRARATSPKGRRWVSSVMGADWVRPFAPLRSGPAGEVLADALGQDRDLQVDWRW